MFLSRPRTASIELIGHANTHSKERTVILRTLVTAISIAFVSGQLLAHDDKPKPKPEASKDDKKGDHKGKDHDKKH